MKTRFKQPIRPEPIGRTIPECYAICARACRTRCGRLCEQPDHANPPVVGAFPPPHRRRKVVLA